VTPSALVLTRDRHSISPYVFSCFVALREKGLAFELEEIALHEGAQRRPDYADATITARVPALRHREAGRPELVLGESSAIVEYLEEAFPPPTHARVLPEDLRERARARQIMAWVRSDDTLPIREERSTTTMFYERATKPLSDGARKAAEKLVAVASRVVRSPERDLFATFSIADADLAFMLMRLVANEDEVPSDLRAWAERQWRRPSVHAFIAIVRPAFIPY
jgi:glutathione S-transferase